MCLHPTSTWILTRLFFRKLLIFYAETKSINSYQPFYTLTLNNHLIYACRNPPSPWGNEDTATLLSILERQNVTATFFFTGGWISKYPDDVKTILSKGHEVGNHSENHKQMSKLTKEQCKEEIQIVHDKVKELTGLEMTVFRPPFGDYNDTVIQAANELGYHVIQWDVDSLDWKDYGCDSILHTVTNHKHLGNGSIILMHNGAKYTKDALEEMIINLKEQGYEFVKVSDLIYKENYQMDHEGRQYVEGLTCPPQAEVSPTPTGTLREY